MTTNAEKYLKAKELVNGGMKVGDASKEVGISTATFYGYKSKEKKKNKALNKKAKVPRVLEIQMEPAAHKSQRVAIVFCNVEDVPAILGVK